MKAWPHLTLQCFVLTAAQTQTRHWSTCKVSVQPMLSPSRTWHPRYVHVRTLSMMFAYACTDTCKSSLHTPPCWQKYDRLTAEIAAPKLGLNCRGGKASGELAKAMGYFVIVLACLQKFLLQIFCFPSFMNAQYTLALVLFFSQGWRHRSHLRHAPTCARLCADQYTFGQGSDTERILVQPVCITHICCPPSRRGGHQC